MYSNNTVIKNTIQPFFAFIALSNLLAAEALVTDRPDATESSSVVGAGVYQLETGFTYTEDGSQDTLESFGTLLRIGLSERWEARVAWDGYIDVGNSGPDGIGDAELGFKYYIASESGIQPEAALIVHTSVPIGDDAFTSDAFDPSFLFSFAHTTSESTSLGYNIGASVETSEDALGDKTTLSSLDYSIAFGFDIAESVGGYIEIFGSQGLSADEDPLQVDGGFTYLLDEDTQFDIFVGAGLNDDAPDFFAGIGFSKRWK